jgi:hypothetical protein
LEEEDKSISIMGTIKKSGNNISVEISVFVYKDLTYPNEDMYIAYCPELDLVGYDTTDSKAKKAFEVVLKSYLDYTTKEGTLEQDLIEHGWKKYKNGKLVEPSLDSMLKKTQLKAVLNQNSYIKYSVPIFA